MKFRLVLIVISATLGFVLYTLSSDHVALNVSIPIYKSWKFPKQRLYDHKRENSTVSGAEFHQVSPEATSRESLNVQMYGDGNGNKEWGTEETPKFEVQENFEESFNGKIQEIVESKTTPNPLLLSPVKEDSSVPSGNGGNTKMKHYLLPIMYFNSGPNYLYSLFKNAITVAVYQHRTLVLLPFPIHGSQGHMRTTDLREFNATFDVVELQQIVDTVSMAEFKHECSSTVEAVYTPDKNYFESSNYEKHVEAFWELHSLALPYRRFTKEKPILFEESPEMDKMKCLGIFGLSSVSNMAIPERGNISFNIQKHLVRSKGIRNTARKIVKTVCDGKPYLAMHFRNKTGEAMRCRQKDGPCAYEMSQLSQNVANIMVDIQMLMKQCKSTCLYVAYPIKYSSAVMDILRKGNLGRIVDQTTILEEDNPYLDTFKADPYMLSLLEQEICNQATLFIAWKSSAWSNFIRLQRSVTQGETINMEDLPSWKPIQ
ncbi:uncharacterized protein [Ptychodera flava]|uniref:uncharacterized protein n=1 Tax=Ptychodera flava TaxID=63121 RepID=UPI00396A8033